jgi:hypothetical protein
MIPKKNTATIEASTSAVRALFDSGMVFRPVAPDRA